MLRQGLFAGRYEISKKIGSGGMADVYEAEDTTLHRSVAIKVLHPQFAQEKNFVERFRREAEAAAKLSHPNIVNIYDWGSEDNTYFIVMEYIKGRNLRELVEETGSMQPKKVVTIMRQILEALDYAHRHNLVHRDVKPHNIIVTEEGAVKVTDFGIARAQGGSSMTQTGVIMGTAHYISPEQATGKEADHRSDLYSLGVVLYELLTGKTPFTGDNPVTVALKHTNETPKRPRILNPDIPDGLEAITFRAMAKDPQQRYQSARAMEEDLAGFVSGLGVDATTAEDARTMMIPETQPGIPIKKKRRWIWVVAFLLLAAIGAGAYMTWPRLFPLKTVVPDLRNLTPEQAKKLLTDKELVLRVGGEQPHARIKEGLIISQTPQVGSEAAKGSTVRVLISSGLPMVEVPKFIGLSLEEATIRLEENQLRLGTLKRQYSSNHDEDVVIGQTPEAGKEVGRASKVDLTISLGPEPIAVPFVYNKPERTAQEILEKAGFRVTVDRKSSDTVPEGTTIQTVPEANKMAPTGSTVTIVVSTGPESLTVPDVVGQDREAALTQLQDMGFEVETKGESVSDDELFDKVIDQVPPADASATKGSKIILYIGQPPVGD